MDTYFLQSDAETVEMYEFWSHGLKDRLPVIITGQTQWVGECRKGELAPTAAQY